MKTSKNIGIDSENGGRNGLVKRRITTDVSAAISQAFSKEPSADFDQTEPQKIERFKCVVAYDGTDYCGWQSQLGGGSVQDFIEARLAQIFKKPVRIHGSGRTDSGVHADAQVFHFDAVWRHCTSALEAALRVGYPDSISILKLVRVPETFHARYSVCGKRYVYYIYEGYAPPKITRYRWSIGARRLDIEKMNEAARLLTGTHNFTAFSANRGDGSKSNPVKNLEILKVARRGREIKVTAQGSGFLYKMVRLLTGALFAVGCGKLEGKTLAEILKSETRTNLFQAAPACGLSLNKVFYSSGKLRKK